MRFAIVSVVVCLMLISTGLSQSIYSYKKPGLHDPQFQVDYAFFKGEKRELIRLEVYYQIYNRDLLFVKDSGGYRADYTISVAIYDDDGIPIDNESRDKEIFVGQYSRTLAPRDFRTGQINFDLPPSKYKVDCHLIDNNSAKIIKRDFEVKLDEYDGRNPELSGIEFVMLIDTTIYDTVFVKNGKTVIPNVRRIFGGDTTSTLKFFFEIYPGKEKQEKILVETRLLDRRLDNKYNDTATVFFGNERIGQIRSVPMRNLKAGEYTVEIILKGRRGRPVRNYKKSFTIHWSPEAMVINDYEMAVQQLKYIATPDEMNRLKKASTTGEKLRAWRDFWKVRDPSPGTLENETQNDYYRRIEFANQKFSVMKREGWRTDRGMIFIIYGEPDQVEDYPFEINQKAYQVWYYYHADNKLREFLFVDEWGNNDFVLQYPYDGIRY